MNSKQKNRLRFIGAVILCAAAALVVALYFIQVIHGKSYAAKADRQYVKPAVTLFDRGTIFLRSKDATNVAGATVADGYLIYMNPSVLVAPEQTYQVISKYIKIDHTDFIRRAGKVGDHYEELAHHITADVAQAVGGLSIAGIGVTRETWRSYPAGEMSAQTIGLIGQSRSSTTDSGGVEGRYGLERSYEDVLNRPSLSSSANMFAQIFSGIGQTLVGSGEKGKGDIVTTLEPTVNSFVEKTMEQTISTWHPDEIGGIVMDPQTGDVIAAVSLPSFDPNNTSSVKDVRIFSNPLVENVYEMGSIMKPLTMSVGLDTGAEKPDSTYDDTGTMTLNSKKISNYDGKARGVIPMQQILSQSLNVGAATVALKAGAAAMYKYFSSFGLGQKSGVDLPNEATGLIGNLKSGKDIDVATASYGQGLAISPLQMIRALSVLADGGYLVQPRLVKEMDYDDGTNKTINPVKVGPVLKKQTVDDVTTMLVKVVDTALKQGAIRREHYSVAAKTGTAQIADHVNGGYYSDRYLHSFFGYFPAYNPRYIIFLYQVWPKGAEYASATLTDPFDEIVGFLINYYNIPPDR